MEAGSKSKRSGNRRSLPTFRSSFRDWAAERTDAPRAVMEAALAHANPNKAEAVYARTNALA